MKPFTQRLVFTAAGLLLAAGPALAQRVPPPGTTTDGGDRAVPRDTTATSRDSGGSPPPAETRSTPTASTPSTSIPSSVPDTPTGNRTRDDRPATDIAVTRTGPRPPRDAHDRNDHKGYPTYGTDIYPPYPTDIYVPFFVSWGIPLVYWDPFEGVPSAPETYPGGGNNHGGKDQGSLKLKVKPRNAKVYVDGFYVGLVDEFDGARQKLTLNGGRHRVEIRAEGFETAVLEVLVTPERMVTFAGEMKRVQ